MTDRDTACIVQFENEQTRLLAGRGWSLAIIDMHIWRSTVDGWVPSRRYAVRAKKQRADGAGSMGTHTDGDTPEQAVANMVHRIAVLEDRGGLAW